MMNFRKWIFRKNILYITCRYCLFKPPVTIHHLWCKDDNVYVTLFENGLGQYGHSYSYLNNQQNVPLPGQLQPTSQIQPNLPGQSAQLHVTHHTPPGGVQTVHQTQVAGFGQSATGGQQVQNVAREYVVQGPSGLPSQQLHQALHQNPQNQVIFDFLTIQSFNWLFYFTYELKFFLYWWISRANKRESYYDENYFDSQQFSFDRQRRCLLLLNMNRRCYVNIHLKFY